MVMRTRGEEIDCELKGSGSPQDSRHILQLYAWTSSRASLLSISPLSSLRKTLPIMYQYCPLSLMVMRTRVIDCELQGPESPQGSCHTLQLYTWTSSTASLLSISALSLLRKTLQELPIPPPVTFYSLDWFQILNVKYVFKSTSASVSQSLKMWPIKLSGTSKKGVEGKKLLFLLSYSIVSLDCEKNCNEHQSLLYNFSWLHLWQLIASVCHKRSSLRHNWHWKKAPPCTVS